jgi:hypothetical protein
MNKFDVEASVSPATHRVKAQRPSRYPWHHRLNLKDQLCDGLQMATALTGGFKRFPNIQSAESQEVTSEVRSDFFTADAYGPELKKHISGARIASRSSSYTKPLGGGGGGGGNNSRPASSLASWQSRWHHSHLTTLSLHLKSTVVKNIARHWH